MVHRDDKVIFKPLKRIYEGIENGSIPKYGIMLEFVEDFIIYSNRNNIIYTIDDIHKKRIILKNVVYYKQYHVSYHYPIEWFENPLYIKINKLLEL